MWIPGVGAFRTHVSGGNAELNKERKSKSRSIDRVGVDAIESKVIGFV